MYDDTRRNEENYDEDGDGSKPRLDIYFGEYEIKNGNYILKTTDSAVSYTHLDVYKRQE